MSSMRWAAAPALYLGFSLALAAQEKPAPPVASEVFSESIDVRVVNVEAVVTDRSGKRVRGLKAGDFRLLVDGKEVPIDYFAEVSEGAAVTASGTGAPVAQGEVVGRNYLVFIDDSVALESQRNDLLKRLKLDLNLLRSADHMAVLAFDGARIAVLANWTDDRAVLAAALDHNLARPGRGIVAKVHQRSPESDVALFEDSAATLNDRDLEGPSILGVELGTLNSRHAASPDAYSDIHKSADAAAAALRAFEAPSGRKVMLLVTGAWTLQYEPGLYGPLLSAANRLGYSVYPADAAQSYAYAIKAADGLARLTGGTAVAEFDNHVFRAVVEDSGTYYWLGFTPSWKADDRSHRMVVEPQRSGLSVRSRYGFADPSKVREAALKTEGLLLFGGTDPNRRLVVKLGAPHRKGRELEVPVTLAVPAELLATTQQGKGYLASAALTMAAVDDKGGRANLRATLQVAVPTLPKAGNFVSFETTVLLRDIGQRLVFSLPDPAGGPVVWGETNVAKAK
ncbi:MAG TPA: VWA domain-containing protein [Thermoanaerobaculia bacterium]|nr:VWA domain-containing protein [Thermoanaerobaculia bacterium]